MKTKITTLLLTLSIVLFFNCSNDDDSNTNFNATVLRQGNKCGIDDDNSSSTLDYLIEFNENVTNLPIEGTKIYYAANLPEDFKIEGLELNITFRDLNEDELVICDTSIGGDEYPFIYVLTAQ